MMADDNSTNPQLTGRRHIMYGRNLLSTCIVMTIVIVGMQRTSAAPPLYTGKGEGVYREKMDSGPKKDDAECLNEEEDMWDQVQALRDLYNEYKDDPSHKALAGVIRNE